MVRVLPPTQLPLDWLPEPLEFSSRSACFLSRDSSDGIVFVYLLLIDRKLSLQVSVLQSGSWGECILAEGQLPELLNDFSEAPELHAAVSRAGFDDGDPFVGLPIDCRNGRLLVLRPGEFACSRYVVRSPLCPTRGMVRVLPPTQLPLDWLPEPLEFSSRSACFLSRDSSDGIVFVYLLLIDRKLSLQVSVLQSGSWGECILAEGQLPELLNDVWIQMSAHALNDEVDHGANLTISGMTPL
ncbi:hypothetical protein ACQ4PT_017848 [Festuca glaucescens]